MLRLAAPSVSDCELVGVQGMGPWDWFPLGMLLSHGAPWVCGPRVLALVLQYQIQPGRLTCSHST